MRVLVVSSAELGVKHAVFNLLRELRERGVDATYLTIPRHEAPTGVERETLLRPGLIERLEGHQLPYLGYAILEFWRRAYDWVGENHRDYDAVWFHTPRLLPLAPSEVASKSLVTYHNHLRRWKSENHDPPASLYYRLFADIEERGIRRFGDAGAQFTVVYDGVRPEVEAAGAARNAVSYVGNGVNAERFTPEGELPPDDEFGDWTGDGETFLSLGSITEQKRPLGLLRFFEALQATTERRHRLLVAGDGPLRERAERFARERDIDGVSFLGFIPEDTKPKILRAVDYFVLPSRYEGEPLALYEALASGTPAIVADIPNLRFVAESECGAVVPFDDPERAAARTREYLESATDEHAENARMYAQTNLSWDVAANEYHELLREIGGERA